MNARALWNKLPCFENDTEFRIAEAGFLIRWDAHGNRRSAFGWYVANGEAVSYLATARPKMGPPSLAIATPPSRPARPRRQGLGALRQVVQPRA